MASSRASYRIRISLRNDLVASRKLKLSPGQVARTLDELIDLGFVEKVKDEFGVTRYRPTHSVQERRA